MIPFVLLFSTVAFADIPAQLSLDQAIAIALKSPPAIRRAAARAQQSAAQEQLAHSRSLPHLSINATDAGQTFNLRALGISTSLLPARGEPFQTVDARAEITQELLNVPTRDRGRAATEEAKASSFLVVDAREALTFDVAIAFAQALQAQAATRTLSRQADLARQLHKISQDRMEKGVASKLDATRSLIQVQNLEQSLLEVRADFAAAQLQLANLIHAAPSTTFELVPTSYSDPMPAPSTRADYRAAESAVHAAELRLQAARHERYPTASFRANYGQNGRAWNDNLNIFLVQGSLHIPIYLGGQIDAGIAEARAKLAEAKADLEELRARIETDTLVARAALESAGHQLEVARSTVDLAKQEVDLSLERFTVGIADNSEVINAQDRLTRAEENVVKAAFHIDIAQARLRRAIGASQ
jgi:outer membrane protein TolC